MNKVFSLTELRYLINLHMKRDGMTYDQAYHHIAELLLNTQENHKEARRTLKAQEKISKADPRNIIDVQASNRPTKPFQMPIEKKSHPSQISSQSANNIGAGQPQVRPTNLKGGEEQTDCLSLSFSSLSPSPIKKGYKGSRQEDRCLKIYNHSPPTGRQKGKPGSSPIQTGESEQSE